MCFFSFSAQTQTVKDESFVKSSLIFNFLEETTYPNEGDLEIYQIQVYNQLEIYNQLIDLSKTRTVKGKKIEVKLITKPQNFTKPHLIYIPYESASDAELIFNLNPNALVVTDELSNLEFSNINFYKTSQQKIQFSVNSKNFSDRQLTPSVTLLVYANANQETLDLIQQSESELIKIKEDYQKQIKLSKEINKKIDGLIADVKKKEDYIVNLVNNIATKQELINQKDSTLSSLNSLNLQRQNEYLALKKQLDSAIVDVELKKDSLVFLQNNLLTQSKKIKTNNDILKEQESQIEQQKTHLEKTDKQLDRTTKNLWILAVFLMVVLVLLYFIIRENTAKKATLKLVAEQNLKIVEASKHKDEFISNLSHEVRTPLNAIIGYTNLVAKNTTNQEDLKYLNQISLSSKNLLGIINDILDLKKIEAGKSELVILNFDLKSVVKDSFSTLELTAKNKGLKYKLVYDESLPHYVAGDPVKLNQVLLNLLGNAIKFTDQGEVSLKVEQLKINKSTYTIQFQITDTGTGIEQEKLDLIFNSFTQENDSISNRFGGTGLGLTISQRFIELMGGKIKVESQINEGTIFSFKIDMDQANTTSVVEDESTTVICEKLNTIKIIYADDLELNRILLSKQFSRWDKNIQIDVAENGKELVEKCKNNAYDIVLTDIRMPVMDGVEATQKIREFNTAIPIVGVSANALSSDIESYLASGMNDYMLKPYQFNELLVKIAQLLNLKYEILKNNGQKQDVKKYPKIWRMSESNEEYLQILSELRAGVKSNLADLKQNPIDYEVAHQLVNKVAYFGDDSLLKLCKQLDKNGRSKQEIECDKLLENIQQQIKPFLADLKQNKPLS